MVVLVPVESTHEYSISGLNIAGLDGNVAHARLNSMSDSLTEEHEEHEERRKFHSRQMIRPEEERSRTPSRPLTAARNTTTINRVPLVREAASVEDLRAGGERIPHNLGGFKQKFKNVMSGKKGRQSGKDMYAAYLKEAADRGSGMQSLDDFQVL